MERIVRRQAQASQKKVTFTQGVVMLWKLLLPGAVVIAKAIRESHRALPWRVKAWGLQRPLNYGLQGPR